MKKILSMLLVLTLMAGVGVIGALGEEKREDYIIEYMLPGAEDSSSLDDPIGQIIYDKFGIIINVIGYAGDWEEKCAMWLAAGDYPDMVQLQGNTMFKKYVEADAVLDIGELAQEQGAENFLSFHAPSFPYWQLGGGSEKIYKYEANTPNMECATGNMFDMLVRSDILEEQGWPRMLTEEDYITVLKKALEDHPTTDGEETLGITFAGAETWMLTTLMMFDRGGFTEVNTNNSMIWNNQKDVFEDRFSNSYFKAGLKFLNTMYQEGLLSEEVFTTSSSTVTEQLQAGRSLSTWYVTWEMNGANKALREAGKEDMQYVIMPNTTQEQLDNNEKRYIRILDSYDWQSVVITKNAKDPARIMELLDWVATEEGQVLIGWGIEGMHYTIAEDGTRQLTQESIDSYFDDNEFNKGVGTYYFLGLTGDFDENGQIYNRHFDEYMNNLTMTERTKEVYSHYGWETTTDPWQKNKDFDFELIHTGLPTSVALDAESDEAALDTKMTEYIYKHIAKLILAESDEAFEQMYSDFMAEYQAFEPQKVIDAYNNRYAEIKQTYAELVK